MERFCVISDIHSNAWALEAVLSDAKRKGVDGFINLGDILYGPLAPKQTYDLLQTEDIITIKGNQDRQIYEATETEIASNPTLQFILSELGETPLEWMRALPANKTIGAELFLCHGAPDSDLVYMLEDVADGYPKIRLDTEILSFIENVNAEVILCGHTHIPRSVTVSTGQLIVNPGSVGLPAYCDNKPRLHKMETHSNLASYCIIEKAAKGWQIEHIKVPYPYEQAVKAAKKRKRFDWAHALVSGRV